MQLATSRGAPQVSGWQGAKSLHADHGSVVVYKGMTDCFVRTVKEEGPGALFKGLWPNYLKARATGLKLLECVALNFQLWSSLTIQYVLFDTVYRF